MLSPPAIAAGVCARVVAGVASIAARRGPQLAPRRAAATLITATSHATALPFAAAQVTRSLATRAAHTCWNRTATSCLPALGPLSLSPSPATSAAWPVDVQKRLLASKKKKKSEGKKKKQAAMMADAPEGRSKKKQLLLERRQARSQSDKGKVSEKTEEAALDFSAKAQKCDVLTAFQREEIHHRTLKTPTPEFYAGSILRVTYKEAMSRKGAKRMVGICIGRRNAGLGSTFTLRNVDEGVPFEAKFDLYSPFVQKIEVLQLARRRRAKLYYLRDMPVQDSYVSPSFTPIPRPESGEVPVIRPRRKKKSPTKLRQQSELHNTPL